MKKKEQELSVFNAYRWGLHPIARFKPNQVSHMEPNMESVKFLAWTCLAWDGVWSLTLTRLKLTIVSCTFGILFRSDVVPLDTEIILPATIIRGASESALVQHVIRLSANRFLQNVPVSRSLIWKRDNRPPGNVELKNKNALVKLIALNEPAKRAKWSKTKEPASYYTPSYVRSLGGL